MCDILMLSATFIKARSFISGSTINVNVFLNSHHFMLTKHAWHSIMVFRKSHGSVSKMAAIAQKTFSNAFSWWNILYIDFNYISIFVGEEVTIRGNQITFSWCIAVTAQWARWRLDCLHKRLFRRRSKKISKLRVTGVCEGNPLVTDEFP